MIEIVLGGCVVYGLAWLFNEIFGPPPEITDDQRRRLEDEERLAEIL
jgi:hypothetical protein